MSRTRATAIDRDPLGKASAVAGSRRRGSAVAGSVAALVLATSVPTLATSALAARSSTAHIGPVHAGRSTLRFTLSGFAGGPATPFGVRTDRLMFDVAARPCAATETAQVLKPSSQSPMFTKHETGHFHVVEHIRGVPPSFVRSGYVCVYLVDHDNATTAHAGRRY